MEEEKEEVKVKGKNNKLLLNLILFIIIMILTFYIIFKNQSIVEILNIISNVDKKYIAVGIISMLGYFLCDALNIGRTLKAFGEKSNLFKNIKYSLIGFFFSGVTPAASGGQPMQVYYMNRDKISVGNSTLALLINLSCMQVVTISIALISLCFNYQYMNGFLIGFFILGIVLNASALTLLLISIFSKRMTNGIINFIVKLLKFFKAKNLDSKKEKLENELGKYQSSATYIKSNKKVIFKNLITTYIQFLLYYSISYWVYLSFGLNSHNILEILSMQSVLYATVSGIPSPGATGVSEGAFLEIFRNVYSKEMINGAVLMSRGINFYLFIIISAIVVIVNNFIEKREKVNYK